MVSLIPLTTENGETLEQIHSTCFPDAWNRDTFDQLLKENNTCGWVATSSEGIPTGFILARVIDAEAEILTFAVVPSSQRVGIGRYLLNALLTFLKSIKCDKVFLEVAIDNVAARSLYSSVGFINVGTRPNYYKRSDQTYVSASVMAYENSK